MIGWSVTHPPSRPPPNLNPHFLQTTHPKKKQGDAAGLQAAMRALVAPLVAAGDEDTAELLVQDILRASSRTASGGDAYAVAASLLVRPGNLLTPAAVEVGGWVWAVWLGGSVGRLWTIY